MRFTSPAKQAPFEAWLKDIQREEVQTGLAETSEILQRWEQYIKNPAEMEKDGVSPAEAEFRLQLTKRKKYDLEVKLKELEGVRASS